MSNYSGKLNLVLPLDSENYDIDIFNNNFSSIDNAIDDNIQKKTSITIAASDTPDSFKKYADVVCTGQEDNKVIYNALTQCSEIILMQGNFYFNAPVSLDKDNITISAMTGCKINCEFSSVSSAFSISNSKNITLKNFEITVGENNKATVLITVGGVCENINFKDIIITQKGDKGVIENIIHLLNSCKVLRITNCTLNNLNCEFVSDETIIQGFLSSGNFIT